MQAIGFALRDLTHGWAGWIAALAGFATAAAVAFLAPRLAHMRIMLPHLAVLPRRAPPHIPTALADTRIDWEGLATHIESRADRLHAIDALHKSGRQIIAAAEFALDDLIADCAAVLLPRELLEREPAPYLEPAVAEAPAEDELPANSLAA
jgi:hypothetical protein